MRRLILLLLSFVSLSLFAQRFDTPLCWFDNSSGRFQNVAARYMYPGLQPYTMYIVDKAHKLPYMGGKTSTATAPFEASAMAFVFPGNRMDDLKKMEQMLTRPIHDSLIVWAKEIEESRNKGGGQLFLFPVGDPEQILIDGKEETVTFMGVKDAKHKDVTVDFGKSPMFLSLFNAQALQVRFHMYRYYDPEADKSALIIFQQSGFDRDYQGIDNELQALAALAGGLSSMLIMGNPYNSQTLKDWINHSTWKDVQPDFERYFHLKPRAAAAENGKKPEDENKPEPPEETIDVVDGPIIRIHHNDGSIEDLCCGLLPPSPDPFIMPQPRPIPPEPGDPQRIAFEGAVELMNGGWYIAENDTATYLIATKQSMIFGLNKTTGNISLFAMPVTCAPKQAINGAGCLKDGRLLIFQSKVGVYDVFNRKVLLEDQTSYDGQRFVVNPVTNRAYFYHKNQMKEYDANLKLLHTYDCPVADNEFRVLRVGRDGRLWVDIGRGFWTQAYTTFMNGKFSAVIQPEDRALCTGFCNPYIGSSFLAICPSGLSEVKPDKLPERLFAAEWKNVQGAAVNSKNEIFAIHDNRVLERFTTKGEVKSAEVYKLDLRFNKKGYFLFQGIYIDALDNIWFNTGKDIYVWHPSGKINGYGSFSGQIFWGLE